MKRSVQKKVCLLGDFAVGKTSLVRQFVEGQFDDRYLSTIGVKVSRKTVELDQVQLNMMIWDLVGGNEYLHTERSYLMGTAGALIVCDLTRENTLDAYARYTQQVRAVNADAVIFYLANKLDLTAERQITTGQLAQLCASLGGDFLLTSAKTGAGVNEAFTQLARQIEGE
ncbi:MAG: GTP-binding protein [Chloroflexi bacterium]|nr:GTP-binding protein [Chloroflexota bacterium]NOG37479.1 GTP-binding protein [Chloroflexota bacterium]